MEAGERRFVACSGGPSRSRRERFLPPLEAVERSGVYVVVDDGAVEDWYYLFIPNDAP